MSVISASEWQQRIDADPNASLLQSPRWGELKSAFGWAPVYVAAENCGALVLFRKLPLGLTVAYIPRGPIGYDFAPLWDEIHTLCRQRHAVYLQVEADFRNNSPEAETLLESMQGFVPAFKTIQPPQTILIPLDGSEDDWLSRMNQKTRYNIRLSQKKDLVVEESTDAVVFHQLMDQTGERDAFGVHSQAYYQRCLDLFGPSGQARVLLAKYQDKPIAAIMLFIQGERGYYLYGASSNEERNRMPNHLLQWRAMQICAEHGCNVYDLWGIPDASEEELENNFTERHDGLWQVYRFKRGFGGIISRAMDSYCYPYNPLLYKLASAYILGRKKAG